MCLLTKQICPIKAKKPIVVYKVLFEHKYCSSDKKFVTPWIHERTELNRLLVASGEKVVVRSGIKNYRAVGPGYIHCYTKIEDAKLTRKYFIQKLFMRMVVKTVIAKCIIEPGTRYYKSWDGKEIAADAVFIKRILRDF